MSYSSPLEFFGYDQPVEFTENRGRPIRPQITRGTNSGEADRSRPCEHRSFSFRKSYATFSLFLYECLYVCCCRAREPRARRRREFRSPGGGAGCHRRPICVAWRGLLITCLSTRGFVIQRRPPLTTPNHPRRQHRHHTNITWWSIRARSWWLRSWPLIGVSMYLPGTRDTTDQTPPRDDDRKPQTLM